MLQKRRAAKVGRRNWWPLAAVAVTVGAAGAAALRRRRGAGGDWTGEGGQTGTTSGEPPAFITPTGGPGDTSVSSKR